MNKEYFENLLKHIQKGMKGRGKADLYNDEYRKVYYIEGQFRGAEFSIDEEEEGLSFTFKGKNDAREEYLVNLISEFREEAPLVKYVLKDAFSPKREDRVHEWSTDQNRIPFLRRGGDFRFPLMITCVEPIKQEEKGKAYTKKKH